MHNWHAAMPFPLEPVAGPSYSIAPGSRLSCSRVRLAYVFALPASRWPAIDTDQPCAGSAADNPASLASHTTSRTRKAAHVSHSRQLLSVGLMSGLEVRRLTGVQHILLC